MFDASANWLSEGGWVSPTKEAAVIEAQLGTRGPEISGHKAAFLTHHVEAAASDPSSFEPSSNCFMLYSFSSLRPKNVYVSYITESGKTK